MSEKLIIPDPYKPLLQAIDKAPYFWAEYPLPEHIDMPQFNRKVVVSGFNSPDLYDEGDMRLYITVSQIFTHKDSGNIFKTFKAPIWEILADTWSFLRDPLDPNKLLQVDKQIIDDETGSVVSVEKSNVQISSIKYLKVLLHSRKVHLVDLFALYLKDFATAKMSELDKL